MFDILILQITLLSDLDLSYCDMDDACLHAIAKHCRNLTILDLEWNDRISLSGVQAVIKSCCQLREINVAGCIAVDKDVLMIWLQDYYSHIVLYY